MRPWLFLLFLVIVSDMVAAAIGGWALWQQRTRARWGATEYLSLLLLGIFVNGFCLLLANTFGYHQRPVYTAGYAVAFWVGRSFHSLCLWAFVLAMFRRRKEDVPEVTNASRDI